MIVIGPRLTLGALAACPSIVAHFVAVFAAVVMTENVVSTPAELGAGSVVVVLVALNTYPVR